MSPRRPPPSASAKARAARIAASLSGLLEDLPPVETSDDSGDPYRPSPAAPPATTASIGLRCPACGGPMGLEEERGLCVHRCARCNGLWLAPGELEHLNPVQPSGGKPDLRTLRAAMSEFKVASSWQETTYRKCPECSSVMNRRNFGRRSGVIVDECVKHGLFLDPGEFEAIETFIAHGGLALEGADRRKYLETEVRKARDAAEAASTRRRVAEARRRDRWSLLEWLF